MYIEMRFYSTGWSFRVGMMLLRWNRQQNYSGLAIEKVRVGYLTVGGMTWREFRLARLQAHEASEQRRKAA